MTTNKISVGDVLVWLQGRADLLDGLRQVMIADWRQGIEPKGEELREVGEMIRKTDEFITHFRETE